MMAPELTHPAALYVAAKGKPKETPPMIDYDTAPVEYVSTQRLKEGDLVRYYGVVFRLKDRKERVEKGDQNTTVVWFKTELVHEPEDHLIPRHWLRDWTIQGTGLATWDRIIEGEEASDG